MLQEQKTASLHSHSLWSPYRQNPVAQSSWQLIKLKLKVKKKRGTGGGSQSSEKEGALLSRDRNVSADGLEVVSVAAASHWHRLLQKYHLPVNQNRGLCNDISHLLPAAECRNSQNHLF